MNEFAGYIYLHTQWEIIEAMHQYGGSFVKALAAAFRAADLVNQKKLFDAFPEYFVQYDEMLTTRRANFARSQNVTGN